MLIISTFSLYKSKFGYNFVNDNPEHSTSTLCVELVQETLKTLRLNLTLSVTTLMLRTTSVISPPGLYKIQQVLNIVPLSLEYDVQNLIRLLKDFPKFT